MVRPFGALLFGRLGDLVGRKYTFLLTILLMGIATTGIGLLPTFDQIGWAAPILLVVLRLIQGLSLSGEYSGAITYVAEHADDERRGLRNLKFLVIAFIMVVGQVVIGYIRVYLLVFMLAVLKIEDTTTYLLIMLGNLVSIPLSILSGWLSDLIGRKWIMLGGCLLAALGIFPIFQGLTHYGNPALEAAQRRTPVSVAASDCNFHILATPNTRFSTCDRVKEFLTGRGVNYLSLPPEGSEVITRIGDRELRGFDPGRLADALQAAGYPVTADLERADLIMVELLIMLVTFFQALTFGPLGAYLVEQFPTRVRFTSVSVAYNFGAGWIGGLTPFFITALSVAEGNVYYGLWFPVIICASVFVLGALLIRESKGRRMTDI